MRSFRWQVALWFTLGYGVIIAAVLVAVHVLAVHELGHTAERRLHTVARGIARELTDAGLSSGEGISPELAATIARELTFVDDENQVAYALFSRDGRLLSHTTGFDVPQGGGVNRRARDGVFLHSIESGPELRHLFSVWRFVLRTETNGYVLFVSEGFPFDLIERLAAGLAIALGSVFLLAIPSGYLLSRRLLRPLAIVRDTFGEVRAGNLSVRVPQVERNREIRELTDAINATLGDLEESFTRIGQFSADAAHELNTPLTALRGNFEVCLGEERSVEEYQRALAEGVDEVTAMSGMVRDLLLLSTGQRQRQGFTRFTPAATVEDVLERLEPVADRCGVRLTSELERDLGMVGDPMLFSRLCYNLVHNAIRFSHPDSAVAVVLRSVEGAVALEVVDHGIGIAPEHQARVFERFYQVRESRGHGSGLGLALVRWIVDLHGGTIEVDSQPERGSRFRVSLPVVREAELCSP